MTPTQIKNFQEEERSFLSHESPQKSLGDISSFKKLLTEPSKPIGHDYINERENTEGNVYDNQFQNIKFNTEIIDGDYEDYEDDLAYLDNYNTNQSNEKIELPSQQEAGPVYELVHKESHKQKG